MVIIYPYGDIAPFIYMDIYIYIFIYLSIYLYIYLPYLSIYLYTTSGDQPLVVSYENQPTNGNLGHGDEFFS